MQQPDAGLVVVAAGDEPAAERLAEQRPRPVKVADGDGHVVEPPDARRVAPAAGSGRDGAVFYGVFQFIDQSCER
ncbi:hypothetical protein Misp03_80540 [Microbispora sp. NBRC 16548]|nr:hypothetical protein Misp03_80540 [Microbispora sp. NBRC 16548]